MSGAEWMAERVLLFIPLLLSLTVHEWAHAFAADRLGDDTPRHQGRLTLDPTAHMDPIGTFVLPLLGVPIGWAKPVVVNPNRFTTSEGFGMMLTAAAGPASNLVLAVLLWMSSIVSENLSAPAALFRALDNAVLLNLGLALFNLLPLPPLDGSRVVNWLMPDALRPAWDFVQARGPLVLMVLLGALAVLGGFSSLSGLFAGR